MFKMHLLGYFFIVMGVLVFFGIAIPIVTFFKVRKYKKVEGKIVRLDSRPGTAGNDLDVIIITPVAEYQVGEKKFLTYITWPAIASHYPIGRIVLLAIPENKPENPTHVMYKRWLKDFLQLFFSGILLVWLGRFFLKF
jgi:hypothetical protein